MILSQAENKQVKQPALIEPEEFDPIELLSLAQQHFHWKIYEFAIAFGCEPQTIYAWNCPTKKKYPSRQAKILAALFKKEWGL
ncbi:MAG: hypothetical protein EAZ18_00380 [Oscillatoriales cyanobacterium]|nr:MAG: hypothetical protein EAZ18_00380 [Oscillatoriales cyanobacterium]